MLVSKTKKLKPLSFPEENTLIQSAKQGDKAALERVLLYNLKYILYAIKPCKANYRYEESDLFQEGVIALMKSLQSYNPNYGYRFGKYALANINKHVKRYVNTNLHATKTPAYLREIYNKILKLEKTLLLENAPLETMTETLARQLNTSKSTVTTCLILFRSGADVQVETMKDELIYE